MPNYWYTLRKTKNINSTPQRCTIHNVKPGSDVIESIYQDLLANKRNSRYDKLFSNFDFKNINSIQAIRDYLPIQYKQYANNFDKLLDELASMYEISQLYNISNIELAPNCYGCIYDCPGQQDHMECPTGCLHDPKTCFECI
jgi:hypothetical protein